MAVIVPLVQVVVGLGSGYADLGSGVNRMSIRRNTMFNLLGAIIPLGVALVTIPIYLGLIGEARYGVLAIAWLLLGYFGLFDLGLGRATAQRIAALRDGTAAERAQTFWTALALNVGLGGMGGLLIWPVAAYFFGQVFKVDEALRPEMQGAVPWLILAVPMATLSGVLNGALQGRERFLELNLISVSSTLLFQLLPLAVARFWGADLAVLLPAALCARLFTLLMLFVRCRRHIFQGHPVTFARAQACSLLRFGGWVTVTAFVSPMMVILDRFIIGAIVGAEAVAFYTVPFQLSDRSTLLSSALTSALFPRFAAVAPEERRRLAYTGLRVLAVVMSPEIAVGILLMEPFLAWWVTPAFAEQSAPVGQVLLLGFWINSFARIAFAQLQAQGNPNQVARCHLAEVLPYFALLFLGLHYFGLVGAAAAFSLRALADFALLAGLAGMLPLTLRLLWVPALLLALAFCIATQTTPGRPEWFGLVGLHGVLTGIWAWRQAPERVQQAAVRLRLFFRVPGKALKPP